MCVKRSFDRISVDGQLSTSDTVFVLANGALGRGGGAREPRTSCCLGEAIDALLRQLAVDIAADGEGAERVGRVIVRGRAEAVEPVARAVADSPLVKTALHGADPNFGRILQAAGAVVRAARPVRRGPRDPGPAGGVGGRGDLDMDAGRAARSWRPSVREPEVEFVLTLPGEGGETEVIFSDLSEAYVSSTSTTREYTT